MADIKDIEYKEKVAGQGDICLHLMECSNDFFSHLSERVNIQKYSKKIKDQAFTFEAWSEDRLVGLVAAYLDSTGRFVYITDVSVLKEYNGLNIATTLLGRCIDYVKENNFLELRLEVHKKDLRAIHFYKKFNFIKYESTGDSDLMKLEI